METGLKLQITNFTDREKVKFNRQLLIYLFFLLVSICFWYLIALSKDYTTTINYSVHYTNFPKGKVLIADLPDKINLKVRGFGFNLLKYKLVGLYQPLNISISNYRIDLLRKENKYTYFLLTRYTKEVIASQLSSDIQLLDVKPDTLYINLADVVEKKVVVRPLLDIQLEKQYMHGAISVKPDSVIISGPQALVDSINIFKTKALKFKDVKDTIIQVVELENINRIYAKPAKVMIIVPVVKYTELIFNIPIEGENVPDSLFLRTFPSSITLNCWVSIADYDKMSPFMFRAVVDYSSIGNSQHKMKVNLSKRPANVNNITFHPKSVEYLIEK